MGEAVSHALCLVAVVSAAVCAVARERRSSVRSSLSECNIDYIHGVDAGIQSCRYALRVSSNLGQPPLGFGPVIGTLCRSILLTKCSVDYMLLNRFAGSNPAAARRAV